jgi:hypothetical protein
VETRPCSPWSRGTAGQFLSKASCSESALKKPGVKHKLFLELCKERTKVLIGTNCDALRIEASFATKTPTFGQRGTRLISTA